MKVKTTLDYLNDLSELSIKNGGTGTDYAIAKMMGVTTSRIGNYRSGRNAFDDEFCIKAASLLGVNPIEIIAAVNLEGKRGQQKAGFWRETYQKAAGSALGVILSYGLLANFGAISGTSAPSQVTNEYTLCAVRNRRKRALSAWFLALVLPWPPVYAENWTTADTWRESAFQVVNLIDWGQTLDISADCQAGGTKYEMNPALPTCPSRGEVNRHFAVAAGLHLLASAWIPARYRSPWQYITLGTSGAIVLHNHHIGLKVSF